MTQISRKKRRKKIARACYATAILNTLFSAAHGQPILPAEASSAQGRPVLPTEPPQLGPAENVLSYGPFDVFPNLRGSVVYDDNIFINPTNKQSDVIWTISPGVMLGAADYRVKEESFLKIEYAPSFIVFTDKGGNNAIDHDGRLTAQWRPGNWTLGVQQGYQSYSGPVVDVGNRVDRNIYTTIASMKYEISPKTSVELDGTQSINDYDLFVSYNEWTAAGWLDYWVTPKVRVGAGLTGGWVDIRQSANQTYQQALVRASYQATDKVEARASAGAELREFQGNQKDRANGVFSLGVTYRPLERTALSLDAYRRNQTSVVLNNQNYTVTGFSGTVRQSFFERYSVSLTGGYDNLKYTANQAGVNANRQDDYYFARVGAEWNVLDRLIVGVFYQYRKNSSSLGNFAFDNHQVGLSFGYQF